MTDRPNYQLFDKTSTAFIFGYQLNPVQRMLDFDFVAERETPSVAAVIAPERKGGYMKVFFGEREILIPVYRTLEEAMKNHPETDVMINFASFRSAYDTSLPALKADNIRTLVIIAEGVPERRMKELTALANKNGKVIIGPATVGGIVAGAFKIGNTAGTIENIIMSKLHRPGSVGFVSKSGGMSNEMYNIVSRNSDGIYEGHAIGGDAYPGSKLLEHLLRYEQNPEIKMLVCLGEVGGQDEYTIVEAINKGELTKPLIMWVTGTCAKVFPSGVQFGHAGAKADSASETADAKNEALKAAGVYVPHSFDDFGEKIKEVYDGLVSQGVVVEKAEKEPRNMPVDFKAALKQKMVRKPASIVSTIADDRGEEPLYNGVPMSEVIESHSLGSVIGLLWYKKKMPAYAEEFIEVVLKTVADHGPAVSGAHNAIITSRAGKDLMSCLAAGILTIGPRFGGAIDGAAKHFKRGLELGQTPVEFVADMKAKGIRIPGIGHRIKSVQNPDKRVELLKKFAKEKFPKTDLLDFALKVEEVTTAKKNNLILNVDGCIGILFVDLMMSLPEFNDDEIDDVIASGGLNALFVLGRSIGMIGHILDQKRLKEGLYRHAWDDILYL